MGKKAVNYKKYLPLLILIAILLIGFKLRLYNVDFPVIGYHNMKENQYVPYAYFMYEASNPLDYFRTKLFWNGYNESGYFNQYELPVLVWPIVLLWHIFGVKIWAARLVPILFSIGSIPLLYVLIKRLTKSEYLSLLAGGLFAIMPLSVFFGRNVQPESAGVFFMLLYMILFFKWRDDYKNIKKFAWFSLVVLIAILVKVPYFIGIVPLLFFVPYKKIFKNRKLVIRYAGLVLLVALLFVGWVQLSKVLMPGVESVGTESLTKSASNAVRNIQNGLSISYWQGWMPALKAYVNDNYSYPYFWLAVLGVLAGIYKFRSDIGRFITGSFVSFLIYFAIFSDKVQSHNYYQMPFLILVSVAIAYLFYLVGSIAKQISGVKYLIFIPLLIIPLTYGGLQESVDRQFNVAFVGEDTAGEFIERNSEAHERVFVEGVGSQSVGIFWYAKRFGFENIPADLSEFKRFEDDLNFRWVVLYRNGISSIQAKPEVWEYIQANYKIRHVGLMPVNGQLGPVYFVLEKGGLFNLTEVQGIAPQPLREYEIPQGTIPVFGVSQ